jgi:hypothetical protein
MLIKIKNKIVKITSTSIFLVILFSFIHSEFGVFPFGNENNNIPDYCTLFEGASLQLTKLSKEIFDHRLVKTYYTQCPSICSEVSLTIITKTSLEVFYRQYSVSRLYLFKNTFQI